MASESNENALVKAINELTQAICGMKESNLEIVRNTANTAKMLERWDGCGVPELKIYLDQKGNK